MPSKLAFTINIKLSLPGTNQNGKPNCKYPAIGAIVRDEQGRLYGNIEMKPWKEWDGKFYLFPPVTKGRGIEEVPETPMEDLSSPPF